MLAIRVRVSPWRERCTALSVGRLTSTTPSPTTTDIAGGTSRSRGPREPATETRAAVATTWPPARSGMGLRPMRDIRSPHEGGDFAAETAALGRLAGHQALAR